MRSNWNNRCSFLPSFWGPESLVGKSILTTRSKHRSSTTTIDSTFYFRLEHCNPPARSCTTKTYGLHSPTSFSVTPCHLLLWQRQVECFALPPIIPGGRSDSLIERWGLSHSFYWPWCSKKRKSRTYHHENGIASSMACQRFGPVLNKLIR